MAAAEEPETAERREPGADDDGPVPVFGTWTRIYLAVIVWAVVVMALVWIFSARTS